MSSECVVYCIQVYVLLCIAFECMYSVCLQSESNSSCVAVFESTRVVVHCIRVYVLLCIAFECMYSDVFRVYCVLHLSLCMAFE